MDYRETAPPPELNGLVKAVWRLRCGGNAGSWVSHLATPDGCLEIIRRLRGRSVWSEEQPSCFVAGVITRPAELRLSSDGDFVGIRLWPWAWNAVGALKSPDLIDGWACVSKAAPGLPIAEDAAETLAAISIRFRPTAEAKLGGHILQSPTFGKLAQRSGRSPRSLQRWFARHVGVTPARYLRLLRFQDAFVTLQETRETLADHAAAHGFADQAHMAREFRSMAGEAASRARTRARGPFL